MQIAFKIIADGADVTAKFQDRLVRLSITDEAGSKSDTASIEIDDRDNLVALPKVGAKLEISLGFVGALVYIGTYVVDEVTGKIGTDTMTIKAKAADMLGGIRARKTRAWREVTMADIAGKIAGEHGLKPSVSDAVKTHYYKYVAQTSESDLNLVTRLAKDLDAVAKPASGHLVVAKRGEGKAADGSDLPVFVVHKTQMSGGSWKVTGRGKYGKVTAKWGERGAGKVRKVSAGKDKPEQTLRHTYATKPEAQRAADAALETSKRGSSSIDIDLGGFWGELMAEAKADLQGIKPELCGEWLIKSVTHELTETLTTRFAAERDNEEEKA